MGETKQLNPKVTEAETKDTSKENLIPMSKYLEDINLKDKEIESLKMIISQQNNIVKYLKESLLFIGKSVNLVISEVNANLAPN